MLDKIITIYAIVDDLLKAIGHTEDIRFLLKVQAFIFAFTIQKAFI